MKKAGAVCALLALAAATAAGQDDPLSSWNDGAAKRAITEFVAAVTDPADPDFVPAPERIAVFDNDGTLWVEQPIYTQLQFAFERVRALAPDHPDWTTRQPFVSVLTNDIAGVIATGEKGLVELVMATHTGMTTAEFESIVSDWLQAARHSRFDRPYTELVYLPMLELLEYLRANEFKTYIVSGGGVEFMRPFTEAVYGVPPEQVLGSSVQTQYEIVDGEPVLMRQPRMFFIDDKAGKPVGIQKFIGRRPIAAFGNSDGDFQMLEWTTAGTGRRLGLIVHHTDAEREYAYDRDSSVGHLERGLDEAPARGWILADMKRDWNRVFAFER